MTGQDKLCKSLKVGAGLALLAPLVYNINFIFPFIFLRNIFFRGLVLILLFIFVLYVFESGRWRGRGNHILYSWLLLLLVLLLATVLGVDPSNSFWGGWERMDGLLNYLFLGVYFLILVNIFTTKSDWIWLMRFAILVALVVCMAGFFRAGLAMADNAWSYLGNSAFLGYYLLLNLGLLAIVATLDKSGWRWAYGACGLIFLLVLFGAASRAPILGLFFGGLIFVILGFKNFSKRWKLILGCLILLAVVFGSLAIIYKDTKAVAKIKFVDRLAHISSTDPTTNNRLLVWGSAWQAFLERPILGYGPENIPIGVDKHYNPLITEQWFDRTHNFALDYLLFAGVFGFLAYSFFVGKGFYYTYKIAEKEPTLGHILSAILAAIIFTLLFVFDTLNSWVIIMVVFVFISWAKNYYGPEEGDGNMGKISPKMYYPVLVVVLLVIALLSNESLIRPVRANLLAGQAYRYSQSDPPKSVALYDQIFEINTFGEREVCMALLQYATTAINAPEADEVAKKLVFEKAEEKALEYLEKRPKSMQVRLGLAQVYLRYASYNVFYLDKAIDLLVNNIDDSPGRVNIYFVIASAYNSKGENDKAIEYLERAYEITKGVKSVYVNLMNLYAQKGETAKVDELIKIYVERFGGSLGAEDYRVLAEYYFKINMIDASKRMLLERAIPADPGSWRAYVSYASILESEGKIGEAIEYLKGVLAGHPDFSEVLGEYITYLESIKK
ncbi:tetratricopeptide repeat protein [Candidatus Kuenenbacteria bacterium]|nr:tetratricopeptide repeat protein [Candidatus Kuenenbacteria bacterium]